MKEWDFAIFHLRWPTCRIWRKDRSEFERAPPADTLSRELEKEIKKSWGQVLRNQFFDERRLCKIFKKLDFTKHVSRRFWTISRICNFAEMRETRKLTNQISTCEALDVSEEDGDLFVAMDVDAVELIRLEFAHRLLLLQRDITNHLLRHERGKHWK